MWSESSSVSAINLVKIFATIPEISDFSFALATVSPLQSSVHMDPAISIQFNSTKVFCTSLELLSYDAL